MSKNIKFHALAISIISLVIVVLYVFIGPKQQPIDPAASGQPLKSIRIGNATWGLACNPYIDEAQRVAGSLQKDKDGKIIPATPVKRASVDNALAAVKTACEGKMECSMPATADALGITLIETCYKKLNVNYRCSDVDRLTTVEVDQGQSLTINCAETPKRDSNAPAVQAPRS